MKEIFIQNTLGSVSRAVHCSFHDIFTSFLRRFNRQRKLYNQFSQSTRIQRQRQQQQQQQQQQRKDKQRKRFARTI